MKFILKGKKDKGLDGFAYSLIASLGIMFALSAFSPTLAVAFVVLILTGSFL